VPLRAARLRISSTPANPLTLWLSKRGLLGSGQRRCDLGDRQDLVLNLWRKKIENLLLADQLVPCVPQPAKFSFIHTDEDGILVQRVKAAGSAIVEKSSFSLERIGELSLRCFVVPLDHSTNSFPFAIAQAILHPGLVSGSHA
jgi:hypothetical protein